MMITDKKHFVTKADIWLVFIVFAAALLTLLFFHMNKARGGYAAVSYDGAVLLNISLSQTEEKYYLLTGQPQYGYSITELSEEELSDMRSNTGDYNLLLYKDGEVKMIESSCPDQICVNRGAVCMEGESIICLPHRIVVEIIGKNGQELDGVAY